MPGIPAVIDLGDLPPDITSFRLYGAEGEVFGEAVAPAGDLNGDGYADVAVGTYAYALDGPATGRTYVAYGSASGFGTVDLSTLTAGAGFRTETAIPESGSYRPIVATAGDVNGDGFADLAIGSSPAGGTIASGGAVHVVYGRADGPARVDLDALAAADGFRLDGVRPGDFADVPAAAGDVNGDGIADLVVGAPGADPNGLQSGSAYVVYGRTGQRGPVDLGALSAAEGFRLDGEAGNDLAGGTVAPAGDVNGDGIADLVVGSDNAVGVAYVVYGRTGERGPLDLGGLSGADGFRLIVPDIGGEGYGGATVGAAGDVNGDGHADLIVGASAAGQGGTTYAPGAVFVVYGRAGTRGPVDLGALAASDGFRLDGPAAGGFAGVSVSSSGDVNGDGFADLLIGASYAEPNGTQSGSAYVVFGRAGTRGTVSLDALSAADGFRVDGSLGALVGNALAPAGDVNADGYDDIILGSMAADPEVAALGRGGVAYVILGEATAAVVRTAAPGGGRLVGGDFDDRLTGSVAADTLVGRDGRDVLHGRAGNDDLSGGAAADRLVGGAGADTLDGGEGNDALDGGAGADRLVGGNGGDAYVVDDAGDVIVEAAAGTGSDRAVVSADWTVSANVERVTLAAAVTLTGNAGATEVRGSDGADRILGLGGADNLLGRGGADTLDGGPGNDRLTGGTGADRFVWGLDALGGRDAVLDFSRAEGDRLDFAALDLVLVGSHRGAGDFTVRDHADGSSTVRIYADADAVPDLTIIVHGAGGPLAAGDFIL